VARAESDARQALDGGDLGWLEPHRCRAPSSTRSSACAAATSAIPSAMPTASTSSSSRTSGPRRAAGERAPDRPADEGPPHPDPHRRERLRRRDQGALEALRERIANGEDFGNLARANSEDKVSAANGGELGWITPGGTVPQFEEVMTASPRPAQRALPDAVGWHLLQVEERREQDSTDQMRSRRPRRRSASARPRRRRSCSCGACARSPTSRSACRTGG